MKVPIEYLENSKVCVFTKKKEIIGGFVLGQKLPSRTLNTFTSNQNLESVSQYFPDEIFCEVCCYWIERKYRKKMLLNSLFWMKMAYEVKKQSKEFILYGTNSRGLAKMYGYPKNSVLFHNDFVNNKETFIFLARRSVLIF